MSKRRLIGTWAAAALLAGILGATQARAQSPLGFTIDRTLGVPGITVHGQVDVDDVNQFCVTDITEFQARFVAQFEGPFVAGGTVGDLPQRFFPDPNNTVYDELDDMSYVLTLAALLGISADIEGALQTAFEQSFVVTFAEIATQLPVGDLGTFDPATGAGSVVVPDIAPGLWAVAAACVEPIFDVDTLEANIRSRVTPFLQSIGLQFGPDGIFSSEFLEFARDFLGDPTLDDFQVLISFVSAIGSNLVQAVVTPEALGVQLFTITTTDALIDGLTTAIDDLIASGAIRRGHGRGLQNRLRAVRRNLNKNPPRTASACRQLGNLIATIQRRVNRGQLSPENGDALISQVLAMSSAIGCGL